MAEIWLVSRVLLKNNYGLTAQKRWKTLGLYFLLFLCFLPLSGILFVSYLQVFEAGYIALGMQTGFLVLSLAAFLSSLFLFPSVFYFSQDTRYLLPLPLKPQTITTAKLITAAVGELPFSLLCGLPLLLAYLYGANWTIPGLCYCMVSLLLVPGAVLLGLGSLTMVVMQVLPFFANKDRFNLIIGIFSLLLAVGLQPLLQSGVIQFQEAPIEQFAESASGFLLAGSLFFFQGGLASFAVAGNSLFLFLASLITFGLLLLLFYGCGARLWLHAAISANASSHKKQKDKQIRQRSAALSYFLVENKRLYRSPIYLTNCLLGNFMLPLIFAVFAFFVPSFQEIKALLQTFPVEEFLPYWALLLLAGLGLGYFNSAMNGIAATAFSREGRGIAFLKYIPLSLSMQALIKAGVGILYAFLGTILFVPLLHMVLNYPLVLDLFFAAGALSAACVVNFLGICIDAFRPKLIWDDEAAAVKNNTNLLLCLFASWILAGLMILPALTLISHPGLAALAAFGISVLLVLLLGWAAIRLCPKFLKNVS